jgi:hypothetical protein
VCRCGSNIRTVHPVPDPETGKIEYIRGFACCSVYEYPPYVEPEPIPITDCSRLCITCGTPLKKRQHKFCTIKCRVKWHNDMR